MRRNPRRSHPFLFLRSRLCGSDDDGSVVTWEGSAVPDEFSLCCSVGNGSVVTWNGSEVPDEFLFCCREEDGSVVTWEGSEAPDEFLLCCREEDGPSSRGKVQKLLMMSHCCSVEI